MGIKKGVRLLRYSFLCSVLLYTGCSETKMNQLSLEYQDTTVELFAPGIISTSLYERDIAISPDGKEIIYTLGNYKQSIRALVSIKKTDEGWGEKNLLPFSGRFNDIEPFFTADGKSLYFASNRPLESDSSRTDYNIWRADRTVEGWTDPIALDTVINTPGEEYYPSLSGNGNLYFTAVREDGMGREDIFVSRFENGTYQQPEPLDSTINTALFEFNAYVDPDEKFLIFSSYGRNDGLGGGDLYYSTRDENGGWMEAIHLPEPINSEALDYCPFVDTSRGVFYFSSDRSETWDAPLKSVEQLEKESNKVLNGMGNIYRLPLSELGMD